MRKQVERGGRCVGEFSGGGGGGGVPSTVDVSGTSCIPTWLDVVTP